MIELLPCPFCGYEASISEVESAGGNGRIIHIVGCNSEDCDVSFHGHARKVDAAKAWNTRQPAEPKDRDALIEAAESFVKGDVASRKPFYPGCNTRAIWIAMADFALSLQTTGTDLTAVLAFEAGQRNERARIAKEIRNAVKSDKLSYSQRNEDTCQKLQKYITDLERGLSEGETR